MAGQYLIILDAGTGGGRCTIFDSNGRQVVSEYREWRYDTPIGHSPLAREFDANLFYNIMADAARTALIRAGVASEEVAAISVTSQREGCVLLDAEGRPIYAGPNMDWRATEEAEYLAAAYGDRIYEFSGHWPHAMFPACRLMWLRTNDPDLYGRAHRLLMINDWILYCLTGRCCSEPSNAGETMLFDIRKREWRWDFIDELGIPRHLMAPVAEPGMVLGRLTPEAADLIGLLSGVPVIVGGADTQMALVGSGAIDEHAFCAVSGTSTPVMAPVDRPVLDSLRRTWTGCHVVPGWWVLEGNAKGTGVVYRWFRDEFFGSETPFDKINQLVREVPAGSDGLMAFLGSGVCQAPGVPFPVGALIGLESSYEQTGMTRARIGRAILEGIACAVEGNIRQMIDVLGGSRPLHVCGGGTRGGVLAEIMASVHGAPVFVNPVEEATSLGAAMIAAVGAGLYSTIEDAVSAMRPEPTRVDPNPKDAEVYQGVLKRWINTFQALGRLL
ncbi:MAG: FGGY-family carbohydrate kinase [Bacteroidota bacterium]